MSAPDIVIASAKRTAVGSFNGAFGNTPAHELGSAAIKAALAAAKLEPGDVDEVILGQILAAGAVHRAEEIGGLRVFVGPRGNELAKLGDARAQALTKLCLTVFNLDEFVYVD